MKICFKCGQQKELNQFYKHPQMLDGHLGKCKECSKKDVRENYAVKKDKYHEYDRFRQKYSRRRMFNHRYNQIRQRVEGRGTRKHGSEGKEMLSYEEYCMWLKDNMDDFERIYRDWEFSGFIPKLTPSIDRKNNNGGYTMDNMRWITRSANSSKGTRDMP